MPARDGPFVSSFFVFVDFVEVFATFDFAGIVVKLNKGKFTFVFLGDCPDRNVEKSSFSCLFQRAREPNGSYFEYT